MTPDLLKGQVEEMRTLEADPWRCCGCGKGAVGRLKPCECPTQVGYRLGSKTEYVVFDEPNARTCCTPEQREIARLQSALSKAESEVEHWRAKYAEQHDRASVAEASLAALSIHKGKQ